MTKPKYPTYAERSVILAAAQKLKMARSAHAYVRGSTEKFYEWLVAQRRTRCRKARRCGSVATATSATWGRSPMRRGRGCARPRPRPDGDRQSGARPDPAGALLATAARGSDLPGVTTARMLETWSTRMPTCATARPGCGRPVTRAPDGGRRCAPSRLETARARERSRGDVRRLPENKRFWPLTAEERRAIAALVAQPEIARNWRPRPGFAGRTTPTSSCSTPPTGSRVAARWAGSAMPCLLNVGGGQGAIRDYVPARHQGGAPCALANPTQPVDATTCRGQRRRVVAGARAMSPYLGNRMLAANLGQARRVARVDAARPEARDRPLTRDEAVKAARFLREWLAAPTHARWMQQHDNNGCLSSAVTVPIDAGCAVLAMVERGRAAWHA